MQNEEYEFVGEPYIYKEVSRQNKHQSFLQMGEKIKIKLKFETDFQEGAKIGVQEAAQLGVQLGVQDSAQSSVQDSAQSSVEEVSKGDNDKDEVIDYSNYPDTWMVDKCSQSKEEVKISCESKKCPKGRIGYISQAIYGNVFGSCPSFTYNFKCFKSISKQISQICSGKDTCEKELKPNDYKKIPFSMSDGRLGFKCDDPKFTVIATCQCTKPPPGQK